MTVDIEKLEVLAKAASQGSWNQDGFDVQNDDIEDYRVSRCNLLADAKFIAAANPTVVLALIAENEALRSVLQEAADEIRELKASVGFRGHTLAVLQRIDAAMGRGEQS